jgi:hypothetical protein
MGANPVGAMAIAVLLAGCAGRQHPPANRAAPIDLMPAFWSFHQQARTLPLPEQAALFERQLVERYPEVYTAGVLGFEDGQPFSDQLQARYLEWAPLVAPHLPLMRTLSTRISADLPEYTRSFVAAFPDFRSSAEIYVLCSLGGFDGATRTVKGQTALMFGVDMIAYVYGERADPKPFFHHELFHLHHAQLVRSPTETPLYLALWREGLAVYVAKTLNPSAKGVGLFGLPEDMPTRAEQQLGPLARAFRDTMGSTESADYTRYFLGKEDQAGFPARSGYYLGYRVAQRLAAKRSLAQLARLEGAELKDEIDDALRAFGAL